jgi:protein-S-isoprenylcysteine O-methyltransferase Ste14
MEWRIEDLNMNKNIMRRLIQVFLTLIIQGLILFLAAGTLSWKWAWIFLLLCVAILTINLFVIPPELIEERGRLKKDAKKWDMVLTSINIIPTILLYVCSGLDYRFKWTGNINIIINILGLVLSFSSSMLFTWSMISNKFFSTLVRLQTDRQHTVATGGPYKFVRHPGYVGYIIMSIATPIALGTLWGLVFSGITGLLLIVRTALEDNTLKKELAGYAEYTEKVKYRLVPLIW